MTITRTVRERLERALELGLELARIDQDAGLHRLSRKAWNRKCCGLGGFATVPELERCRERMKALPALWRETAILAELWRRSGQDRPAVAEHVFGDGDRFVAAYAERVTAGLSVDKCSAVAAFECGQQRPDEAFGALSSWGELDALIQPLRAELAELDDALSALVRLDDLGWRNGRPVLEAGAVVVEIDQSTASAIASAFAAAAHLRAPGRLAA